MTAILGAVLADGRYGCGPLSFRVLGLEGRACPSCHEWKARRVASQINILQSRVGVRGGGLLSSLSSMKAP